MPADRIRRMTGLHWLALFGLILTAWAGLYAMAPPADPRAAGWIGGAGFWGSLCRVTPAAAGFGQVALMWALMAAAMMVPSVLPAVATYDDLPAPDKRRGALVAGYLAIWAGFALIAAALQTGLYRLGLVSAFGDSLSPRLSGALLLLAGLYQFSAFKAACAAKCRAPLAVFFQHWEKGAWRIGLRLGLACLGCCWALMLLAFVGGMMNLAFMGLAMAIMIAEKLPRFGRHVTWPLGAVLLALAGAGALGAIV